jgi:peptidoglycan/LPS O-acetylase OafA/YrhL
MGKTTSARTDHVGALDGLRGIAILLVLWAHLYGISRINDRLLTVLQPGHFGVDIFFVLSGFLITRILLSEKEKGSPVRYFLFRRFLRIFPIYYLLLLILLPLRPAEELVWSATYLSNFYFPLQDGHSPLDHTWSLAVEEHFYLLWPVIVFWLSRRQALAAIALFFVLSVASALAFMPDEYLRRLILKASTCRFASLALGALFAYQEVAIRKRPGLAVRVALVGFLVTIAVGVTAAYFRPQHWGFFLTLFGGLPASASIVLAGIVVRPRSLAGRLLNGRPLRYVGRISYGLYLYHYPVFFYLGLVAPEQPQPVVLYALAIGLSFACASVSYRFIESPLLKWKDRYRLVKPATADGPGPDLCPAPFGRSPALALQVDGVASGSQ